MKALRVVVWTSLVLLLIALAVYLRPGKRYSGPGIPGNLDRLQQAKIKWEVDHPGGSEWPTKKDLAPYLAREGQVTTVDEAIRSIWDESYIINRRGQPVYAFIPNKGSKIHDGELHPVRPERLAEMYSYYTNKFQAVAPATGRPEVRESPGSKDRGLLKRSR